MAKTLERRDRCCLCGKAKEQVPKLIVGLHGAVCSDCIDLCNDILQNEGGTPREQRQASAPSGEAARAKAPAAAATIPGVPRITKLPKPKEIVSFLDQYVIGQ